MADLGSYDQNAKPATVFDPLPAGKYVGVIVESDVRPTNGNTGDRLTMKWLIVGDSANGAYHGRYLFDSINIRNQSQKAQEIGQRQLASLRLATGVNSPRASEELHNIPVELTVKVKPAEGQYGPKNEIRGYAKVGESAAASPAPAQQAPAPQQAQPAANKPAGVPPWKRK